MNMNDYVQYEYLPSLFDPTPSKKRTFLSKPEKVKMFIGNNGTLNIKGQRYLKLGKIMLYDPIRSENITK